MIFYYFHNKLIQIFMSLNNFFCINRLKIKSNLIAVKVNFFFCVWNLKKVFVTKFTKLIEIKFVNKFKFNNFRNKIKKQDV